MTANELTHFYTPPSRASWSGRDDEPHARLFQQIQLLDCQNLPSTLPEKSVVLLGFACEAGVKRNLGRPGAVQGPEQLRKALRNLPINFFGNSTDAANLETSLSFPKETHSLWDAGTILCPDEDLEKAQELLGESVAALRECGAFVIVLGGGHEMAWGDFQGLVDPTGIDVLNFDAHFDVRPLLAGGKGSSGTCFRQMHEFCQEKNIPFRYGCFGIQPFGNTKSLFDYASAIKAEWCFAEMMVQEPQRAHEILATWLTSAKRIYLTLCLDVFAAAYAPGVSAPQTMGLTPQVLLPFFRQVLESGKVIGFDVAELNPLYDRDEQTAALAAYFVGKVIHSRLHSSFHE